MRSFKKVFFISLLLISMVIVGQLFYLRSLRATETYPADQYLQSASNKTALIVTAHDDDAIAVAGTISQLTKKGWQIHFLTFYGNWHKEDNPTRKKEAQQAASIQQLAGTQLLNFVMQRSDTVKEPWMPIPYEQFPIYLKTDSLRILIGQAIERIQPDVIFSLDNITGGYGHPEHVCVSQLVVDICTKQHDSTAAAVHRIYQAVYTPSMNERITDHQPVFAFAKKVYGVKGMPVPDVEIDISGTAQQKKQVMIAYTSQHRNLKKFWPFYNWYPYWIYFRIFDKEYFRVIDFQQETDADSLVLNNPKIETPSVQKENLPSLIPWNWPPLPFRLL